MCCLTEVMRAELVQFLGSLSGEQRAVATYDLTDEERFRWQYTPGPRSGLSIAAMEPAQRELAMRLVDAGLSARGADVAR